MNIPKLGALTVPCVWLFASCSTSPKAVVETEPEPAYTIGLSREIGPQTYFHTTDTAGEIPFACTGGKLKFETLPGPALRLYSPDTNIILRRGEDQMYISKTFALPTPYGPYSLSVNFTKFYTVFYAATFLDGQNDSPYKVRLFDNNINGSFNDPVDQVIINRMPLRMNDLYVVDTHVYAFALNAEQTELYLIEQTKNVAYLNINTGDKKDTVFIRASAVLETNDAVTKDMREPSAIESRFCAFKPGMYSISYIVRKRDNSTHRVTRKEPIRLNAGNNTLVSAPPQRLLLEFITSPQGKRIAKTLSLCNDNGEIFNFPVNQMREVPLTWKSQYRQAPCGTMRYG